MENSSLTSDPILLLGFTLAHAAWSIAEAEVEELLCLLAFIEHNGNLEMLRFESETQENAISKGKDHISIHKDDALVSSFAREGLFSDQSEKIDVFLVESWSNTETDSYGIIQKFVPNQGKGKFQLIGEPIMLINGVIQTEEIANKFKEKLEQGIQSHFKVAPLWNTWKNK
jgi:hypothetical protein